MAFSDVYYEKYQGLPEELAHHYSDLNFDNHCYLRIALDNTVNAKWDTQLKRPAYKHLSTEQLNKVLQLLHNYRKDKALLLQHNTNSLGYRKAWKAKEKKSTS